MGDRELRKALAFATSVIKSGEPWTPTCDAIISTLLAEGGAELAEIDEWIAGIGSPADFERRNELLRARRQKRIGDLERTVSEYDMERHQMASELATLKAAGTRAEGIEAAAKVCDESEAEATRLRDLAEQTDAGNLMKVSRTSWVNTSRMLAAQIRALSPKDDAKAATIGELKKGGIDPLADQRRLTPDAKAVGEIVQYRCPVCGIADENAYLRCFRPNCTDGRDPRPQRRFGGKEG